MNRLNKIVAEAQNAEALRKQSIANAMAMFDQARQELKQRGLSEITLTIPELDQRDGGTTYLLSRKSMENDPGYPSIDHMTLSYWKSKEVIATSDRMQQYNARSLDELFKVANYLMAAT